MVSLPRGSSIRLLRHWITFCRLTPRMIFFSILLLIVALTVSLIHASLPSVILSFLVLCLLSPCPASFTHTHPSSLSWLGYYQGPVGTPVQSPLMRAYPAGVIHDDPFLLCRYPCTCPLSQTSQEMICSLHSDRLILSRLNRFGYSAAFINLD